MARGCFGVIVAHISTLLKTDYYIHLVRLINLTSGTVTTIAGNVSGAFGVNNYGHADGVGTLASLFHPHGVAIDAAGTFVVVVRVLVGLSGAASRLSVTVNDVCRACVVF